jgi:hypothetical protein
MSFDYHIKFSKNTNHADVWEYIECVRIERSDDNVDDFCHMLDFTRGKIQTKFVDSLWNDRIEDLNDITDAFPGIVIRLYQYMFGKLEEMLEFHAGKYKSYIEAYIVEDKIPRDDDFQEDITVIKSLKDLCVNVISHDIRLINPQLPADIWDSLIPRIESVLSQNIMSDVIIKN